MEALMLALRVAPDAAERSRVLAIMIRRSIESDDPAVRSPHRANQLAEELVRLAGDEDPAALSVLATARAEAGKMDEAAALLERAIAFAQRRGPQALLPQLLRQRDALRSRREDQPAGPESPGMNAAPGGEPQGGSG